ncbi:MAG: 2-oxo acid dehydrogenase subunit E2 [Treponema sp.]|jgi:pyruvate dehydrogenase E2 component (dihydrolipoamide acetyltransferase)|nr:2-oxo acid dehydrogenase subunit E2 [Treponema sp.]
MAHILIMPRQGNTVESCIIVDWKVKEGDEVTAETTVCEVETDKAAFEVPAGAAGVILKLLFNAGDDVPVLAPIAVIGEKGENWQIMLNSISPRARNFAQKEAVFTEMVPGTGPGGRIVERDVLAALENRPALTAAAKAAGAASIPNQGTGIGGRVTIEDLASGSAPISQPLFTGEGTVTETPIKGIRKIISDRMLKSLAETAQFTLNASASVSRLQDIRSKMNETNFLPDEVKTSKITVNDMILFAVSRILPRYLYMNTHKIDETTRTFEDIHLGMAVDTPRGLMVPVIRNANLLSLAQISSETKRLADSCKNGTAKPQDLSGSTFTISNLGNFGITSFTPVLNTPEVAILGVCTIEMKPVPSSCACRFEPFIGFSLTINHQVVDGAPAARFLKALCEAIAEIDLLLANSN